MNYVDILLLRHTSCLLFPTSSVILYQFDVTMFSLLYWSNTLASGISLKFHFRRRHFFPSIFLTMHASLPRVNTGLQLKIVFNVKSDMFLHYCRFECLTFCFSRFETVTTYIWDPQNTAFHLVSIIEPHNFYILFKHLVMYLVNTYYMNTAECSIELHQLPLADGGSSLPTHTNAVDGNLHAFLISVSDTGERSASYSGTH
jgi:hypothetical protein